MILENDDTKVAAKNIKMDDTKVASKDIKIEKNPRMLDVKLEKEITNIELNLQDGHDNEALAEITQFKQNESAVSDAVRKW